MSNIQTCILDLMNLTVKELKRINKTLDMPVSFIPDFEKLPVCLK